MIKLFFFCSRITWTKCNRCLGSAENCTHTSDYVERNGSASQGSTNRRKCGRRGRVQETRKIAVDVRTERKWRGGISLRLVAIQIHCASSFAGHRGRQGDFSIILFTFLSGKAVKDDLDFCRQEEKRVEDSFGSLYAQRDSGSTLQVSHCLAVVLHMG